MGRMTKTPFSGTMKRASDLLEIIHADACDPMRIKACGGYRYFLIHFAVVFQVASTVKQFHNVLSDCQTHNSEILIDQIVGI